MKQLKVRCWVKQTLKTPERVAFDTSLKEIYEPEAVEISNFEALSPGDVQSVTNSEGRDICPYSTVLAFSPNNNS